MISRLGSVLAEKVGSGPLSDLKSGLLELRRAVEALLPGYVANEKRLAELQSEGHAAQRAAQAADSEEENSSVESEKEPIVLLQEATRNGRSRSSSQRERT